MSNLHNKSQSELQLVTNNLGVSYILWLGGAFGVAGLHRLYNRKFISGIIWLCTLGFFGIGQFIDLFLIPEMVNEHNLKARKRLGLDHEGYSFNPLYYTTQTEAIPEPRLVTKANLTQDRMMILLAKAAYHRGGKLSVTQAVVDTELSFEQVDTTLQAMFKLGYVEIDNHPTTGAVVYHFTDL